MNNANIFGTFSEEQVSRLTGLSRSQLSNWRRDGFVVPEFINGVNPRVPFTFVYSFKDLLTLRLLNQLRNVHGVSLQELKKVGKELKKLGIEDWTSKKLWVFNRKVVFIEPTSEKLREISSQQFVAEIPLDVVTTDASADIKKLNERSEEQFGVIEKRRQVVSSQPIFSGTRIPVAVVIDYLNSGKSENDIFADYPMLNKKDIEAARLIITEEAA